MAPIAAIMITETMFSLNGVLIPSPPRRKPARMWMYKHTEIA